MKKFLFLFILALSYFFTACDKGENQVAANGEIITEENTTVVQNTGDDEGELTFRVPCVDADDCEVTIEVISGTANLTVCGITDGSFGCSGSTNCGTLNTEAETYTPDHFSFCVPHEGTFRVRNNDSNSVTIELTVSGITLPNQVISGNSSADFELAAPECSQVDPC